MNPDYTFFSTIDFAVDDAFLQHYLFPTEQSVQFWESWLDKNPSKKEEWNEAVTLIEAVQLGLSDYTRAYLSEEKEADLLHRILETNHENVLPLKSSPFRSKFSARLAVAACITLLITAGSIWIFNTKNSNKTPYNQRIAVLENDPVEKINTTDKVQVYYLPDSTEVELFPSSKLSYTDEYGQKNRTVYLSGKAGFEVKKNPEKPFFVYANEIVTKVLGTRFEVSAFDKGSEVIVKVQSGQVSVYRNREADQDVALTPERTGVLLLPNQQVVFKRQTEQFNKVLVDNPALLAEYENKSFIYEELPVVQVFNDIQKAYGIDIVYQEEVLKNCGLTANLNDEELLVKLDIICKSIGATYEIVDAQIVINSKGCKRE